MPTPPTAMLSPDTRIILEETEGMSHYLEFAVDAGDLTIHEIVDEDDCPLAIQTVIVPASRRAEFAAAVLGRE